jgi:hypothetical protein
VLHIPGELSDTIAENVMIPTIKLTGNVHNNAIDITGNLTSNIIENGTNATMKLADNVPKLHSRKIYYFC